MKHTHGNKKIWFKLAVLCLLIAAAASLILFQQKLGPMLERMQGKTAVQTPDQLLQQYYTYIGEGNYEKMYEMLDEESRTEHSMEDFVSRNQKIYQGIEAQNIAMQVTGEDDGGEDEAYVLYDVKMDTVAGEISFSGQARFTAGQKGEAFGIDWNDAMIFPQLTPGSKVRVSTSEAKRGNLLDRNGRVLAGEGIASSVGLVPGQMNEDSGNDIQTLADILGVSVESIEKKLGATWVKSDSFVPVKTVEALTQLEKMAETPEPEVQEKLNRNEALAKIPGVQVQDTTVRQYPLGEAASHLTGYLQKVTAEDLEQHPGEGYGENSVIGRSGLESLYEEELRGKNGCEITVVDAEGKTKSVLASIPRQDGSDISLTIDADLQQTIYDTFSGDKSCSVAMDPYTGEVLALVSTPTFDSNDFILGMSEALWDQLNEDGNKPLYNRFRQKLCPGSSFKPIIAAVGLKTRAIDPAENLGNSGLQWQKDSSWGNYYVTTLHASNPASLSGALICSDNIYFAKAALKIGSERLRESLDGLGFQEPLPFEIAVAQSQYSNDGEIGSEIQLADSGYGQGQILVNPIHLAALYTGFANQGDVLKPYIRMEPESQKTLWIEGAYQPEQAEQIRLALSQVIESPDGTGKGAYRQGVALAGKTGTAEIKLSKEDQNGTELGWFCIFDTDRNAEKPLLLLSMVEDVKERGGSGYVVKKDNQILDAWYGSAN